MGSTVAFCLLANEKIEELILINNTKSKAEGLKYDLIGTYPKKAFKLKVGDYSSANNADIILITCGIFGAPAGSNLYDLNKAIIQEVFSSIKPKKTAKIVVTTTPCDRIAYLVWKLTYLDPKNLLGFGGQLDVNRLKYLIWSDTNNSSKNIEANFIGEHGKRGIPVFNVAVSNRNKLIDQSRNYFGLFLKEYNASIYGTAAELSKLVDALMSQKGEILTASYYEKKYGIFVTWPCVVNRREVKPVNVSLTITEKKEFDDLVKVRKSES